MPASPAKVSGSAPIATPSRVISASPRVISAARGLCPSPRPSRIPAAIGDHVLERTRRARPRRRRGPSRPGRSASRRAAVRRARWPRRRAAATTAVGWPWQTSIAKLGPESAANRASGSHSANTSRHERQRVVLDALGRADHQRTAGHRASRTRSTTARTAWLGGAETMTPAPLTASRGSRERPQSAASRTPGRNSGFSCVRLIASTTSGSYAQRRTVSPLPASRLASVVPQLPAPSTATALMDRGDGTPRGGRTGSRCP